MIGLRAFVLRCSASFRHTQMVQCIAVLESVSNCSICRAVTHVFGFVLPPHHRRPLVSTSRADRYHLVIYVRLSPATPRNQPSTPHRRGKSQHMQTQHANSRVFPIYQPGRVDQRPYILGFHRLARDRGLRLVNAEGTLSVKLDAPIFSSKAARMHGLQLGTGFSGR